MIQGHYITVSKWKPFFNIECDIVARTLTWIRIPNIPLEFFEEDILLEMGSLLGKVVKVDNATMRVERGKYARICVEIYLRKQLVSRIKVNGKIYNVVYERIELHLL